MRPDAEPTEVPDAAPDESLLKYLVYTSTPTRPMSPEDFESILLTARERNRRVGITGILLFRDDCFIQFLEGPPAEVDALLDDIVADERHHHLRVILTEMTADRSFPDWQMGFGTPPAPRPSEPHGARDSFTDLAAGPNEGVVRQAAGDLSDWFTTTADAATS